MLETNYATELNKLRMMQKKDFHQYIQSLHEDKAAEKMTAPERWRKFEDNSDDEVLSRSPNRGKLTRSGSSSSGGGGMWSGVTKAVSKVNPLRGLRSQSSESDAPPRDEANPVSPQPGEE